MPQDKSLWFYGAIYDRLSASQMPERNEVVVDLVPEGASVLDIACGTGQLCFALRRQKHCRVVGVDLSLRMLDFARKADALHEITFIHGDATDLSAFGDRSFDYAAAVILLHELAQPDQMRVLREALRVARKAILVDSAVPLPPTRAGFALKLSERVLGRDHVDNFWAYMAAGGIGGIVKQLDLPVRIEHTAMFAGDCRQVVVLSAQQ